ncbi:MAG: hypothetical protein HFJ41_03855 [Clostridia bacterium]|nr:hypothetical protein [Clostridia bacterium]
MILGKDKKTFEEIEQQIIEIRLENVRLQSKIDEKEKTNLQYREIVKEFENLVKAMLFKFNNYQIEIDKDDIRKAEKGEIYIEQSYMKFAKIVKLIFKENKIKNKP